MTTPRNYQTEAIIIRKTKLGEADSILTLYTPRLGKIQGFAKSLRKPKSRLAGHLELLTYSQVSLARGRSIDTITGSQTINSFLPLKTDLDLASYALYVIELVNQFTPEHAEDYPLFRLLLETMERLCSPEQNRELVLRYFELHLLEKAGYRPQLHQCVSCRTTLEPVHGQLVWPASLRRTSPAWRIENVLMCRSCRRIGFVSRSLWQHWRPGS